MNNHLQLASLSFMIPPTWPKTRRRYVKIARIPDIVAGSVLGCGALLIYDYVILFDQEVELVWLQPWMLGSVLFFVNRYLPFIDTSLSLHLLLGHDTAEGCTIKFTAVTWLIALGIVNSEFILMFRTYTIWGGRRFVLVILCATVIVCFIPALVVLEMEIKSLKYVPNKLNVCDLAAASTIIIFSYILLTLSETVIAVLTGIKAYQHFRHYSATDWIARMYRDGLLFYVYLFSISLANVLVPILAPPQFDNWLATPQRVVHSVLCTRVLLLIFKQKPTAASSRSGSSHQYSANIPEFGNAGRSGMTTATTGQFGSRRMDEESTGHALDAQADMDIELTERVRI